MFMFSKKAMKIDRNLQLRHSINNLNSKKVILSNCLAFLEKMNFMRKKMLLKSKVTTIFNNRWPNDDHEVGLG